MQNEILKPVLATDETAIPRYDIVKPDGSVAQQNVELRLKNEVMQQGTPYDEESVLPATLCEKLGLPNSATPANAFEAVLAKAGAKVSMNEPNSQDNIAAGYSVGAMWLRPYYTLTNMVYALEASSITPSACTVNKSGQTFTVAGNGDDKVISVSYTMPTNNGWLYAVVTPDSTASSATIVVGDKTVELTPGSASTVCVQFTGTALQVSATYSTANTASSGTIEIKNLTVLDNAATVVQCVDSEQDITVASIQTHCDANAPYSTYNVPSKLFQQTHDEVWEVIYDSGAYTNQEILSNSTKSLFNMESTATPDDVFAYLGNFKKSFVSQYLWEKYKEVLKNACTINTSSDYAMANIFTGNVIEAYNNDFTFYYADSYYIGADSKFHLQNYTAGPTFNRSNYNSDASRFNVLRGKYAIAFDTYHDGAFDGSYTKMYQIPSDATFSNTYVSASAGNHQYIAVSKADVYQYPVGWIEKNDLSYLASESTTAYPPQVSDGYTYNLLGLVGDGSHKVEIKRYVGTGTWGVSNPTILTFDKDPIIVMMMGWYQSATWYGADSNYYQGNNGTRTIVFPQLMDSSWKDKQGLYSGDISNYNILGKYENKKLYCYANHKKGASNDASSVQFNYKDYVYVYMVVY